jgi:hypothetical protein
MEELKMRISIQHEGNEAVVRGDAEFVHVIVEAVQRYEARQRNRDAQLFPKEKKHHFKDEETMRKNMAKARAAKKAKSAPSKDEQMKALLVGRKKVKRHRAPRWTEEENEKLWDFVNNQENYRFGRGKVVINGKKMKLLARELRRTSKSISLRITGVQKYKDAREHMKQSMMMRRSSDNKSWFQ